MPFAEACSVCRLDAFMMMLYDDPGLAHSILAFLTGLAKDFAAAQIEAGAPMIGAGDAAASLISPEQYREFALPYEIELIEFIHARKALVKLHICGNTSALLPDMAKSGADLFNVDHLVGFDEAVRVYGGAGLAYKGNLDPVGDFLGGRPEDLREAARSLIARARGTKYILSAGCEIPPSADDAAIAAFCGAAAD
jgi:MtaA/CmuA family methyltransferase